MPRADRLALKGFIEECHKAIYPTYYEGDIYCRVCGGRYTGGYFMNYAEYYIQCLGSCKALFKTDVGDTSSDNFIQNNFARYREPRDPVWKLEFHPRGYHYLRLATPDEEAKYYGDD